MAANRRRAAPDLPEAAAIFAALGDETRLRIAARLSEAPQSVTTLADGFPISRQGVTKHLRVLAEAGLATSRERGRARIWQIEPARLALARRHLERISVAWDRALGRLAEWVERADRPTD